MIQQTIDAEAGRLPVRRTLQRLGLRRTEEFWALRDVSFEVERGETLGIIGHNGAGKSTILKLLSNVTAPTSGEIAITGRAVLQPLSPGPPASPNGGRQPCLPGSSRPFGEGTDSPGRTLDEVIYTWVAFQLRHSEYDSPGVHIRNDLRAARDVEAPEGAERGEVPRAGPQ